MERLWIEAKHVLPPPPPFRGALLALVAAGFALPVAACVDDDLAEAPMSLTAASEAPLADDELGESPILLALGREIPGFGGIYYEPGEGGGAEDRLVLAVTEAGAGDLPMARKAVLAAVARFAPPTADAPEMLHRVVEHTFLEMAEHRARLRPRLFAMDEVVSLGVDEKFNRIKVGVTDLAFASAVEGVAAELGVPGAMLEIVRGSPVERLAATVDDLPGSPSPAPADWPRKLTDRIPDRRLAGGYEAGARVSPDPCTTGFTTVSSVWTERDGRTKGFVSASHCTQRPLQPDVAGDGDWKQPHSDWFGWDRDSKEGLVGQELWDPAPEWCEHGECRHADAALMEVDEDSAGIAFGKIARTMEAQRSCTGGLLDECELRIDQYNPTFTILFERPWPGMGRSIHKVGRTTGWTYGTIAETCVDDRDMHGIWIYCSHKLKLFASGGDSGAPVFMFDDFDRDSTEVHLVGIVWGRDPDDATVLISNIDQIRKEFRDQGHSFLTYFHRDSLPPDIREIEGPRNPPKSNPPAFFEWKWIAVVKSEGMQPVTYEWSGVLSGTGDTLVARMPSDSTEGWLFLELTDAADQFAEDSIYINTVDGNRHPDYCIEYDSTGVN